MEKYKNSMFHFLFILNDKKYDPIRPEIQKGGLGVKIRNKWEFSFILYFSYSDGFPKLETLEADWEVVREVTGLDLPELSHLNNNHNNRGKLYYSMILIETLPTTLNCILIKSKIHCSSDQ